MKKQGKLALVADQNIYWELYTAKQIVHWFHQYGIKFAHVETEHQFVFLWS